MNNSPRLPNPDYLQSLDQLKQNLQNLFETAKIVSAAIKRREAEIEKKYPGVKIKLLMLIHYDHNGNCVTYECDYLKSDVEMSNKLILLLDDIPTKFTGKATF